MLYSSNNEWVVLVNEHDKVTGVMEKLKAHQDGMLHRALSVFIFNNQNELMLHQRALGKYHSGGLWTNTCCSHPREGETVYAAARRRLFEEMKLECELSHAFSFVYKAPMDNNLIEHEFDHVFTGVTDAIPNPDPAEVADWKFMSEAALKADIAATPEKYTHWFRICIEQYSTQLFQRS